MRSRRCAQEAAIRGPIAVVRDGDVIIIDIPARMLRMDVSKEEIAARMESVDWTLEEEKFKPFLRLLARNVTSTAQGATWK